MARRTDPPQGSDSQVRALLDKYRCPVPFHAVRTRILGRIVSPAPQVAPGKLIEELWAGEPPVFDSIDDANELFGALLMGLWNRLTRHQEPSAPFRLTRIDVSATSEGLARLVTVRQQELQGFNEGLFGPHEVLDLPETAHQAVGTLTEIRAMLKGLADLAADPDKPGTDAENAKLMQTLHEFTQIMEHEINQAVLSCTRARRRTAPPRRPRR